MNEYNQIQNSHLGLRVPTILKDRLRRYADKEYLKSSDIIRRALIAELERLREIHEPNLPRKWNV